MSTSLFNPEDLLHDQEKRVKENKAFGIFLQGNNVLVSLGKQKELLENVVGDISDRKNRMLVSYNAWSMHDLLFYCLEKTGPACVDLITWQISQRSIRMLSEGLQSGLVKELNCLLDRRTPIRRSGEMAYIRSLANKIFLIDCHAKITMIKNNDYSVTLFSSANMTRNNRIEFYIIYFDEYIYDFNKEWFSKQLEGASPFEYEGN